MVLLWASYSVHDHEQSPYEKAFYWEERHGSHMDGTASRNGDEYQGDCRRYHLIEYFPSFDGAFCGSLSMTCRYFYSNTRTVRQRYTQPSEHWSSYSAIPVHEHSAIQHYGPPIHRPSPVCFERIRAAMWFSVLASTVQDLQHGFDEEAFSFAFTGRDILGCSSDVSTT